MEPTIDMNEHVTFASCVTDDPVWTQTLREDVAWNIIFIGVAANQALKALDREEVQTDVLLDALCRINEKAWAAGAITRKIYVEQHAEDTQEDQEE